MTLAIQTIDTQVLRDTLLAMQNPPLSGTYPIRLLVPLAGASGQYKVFWESVPDEVELPYITLHHIMGGRVQGTQVSHGYSDTQWKVVGHTGDIAVAEQFANAISLLDTACPVTTAFTGISAVSFIEEVMPIFDRYQVQNNPMFVVGGLYHLRLSLGDN